MFPEPTRTDHVNKSYRMADGGVVPAAGKIGAFPSAIMPSGAPDYSTPPPQEKEQPEKEQSRILTPGEQIGLYGSHR